MCVCARPYLDNVFGVGDLGGSIRWRSVLKVLIGCRKAILIVAL